MHHHGALRPGRQITAILFALALAAAGHADTGSPHGKGFALDCELCHTVNDWRPLLKPLPFDHASTGFALHGAHGDAGCRDCHESLEFALIGTQCGDCHTDAHAGSLGFDCEVCHGTTSWENQRAVFDAHASTLFPLLRPHTGLDCEACHGGQRAEQFATTPTDCYTCHLRDFAGTTDPNHVAASFSTDCQDCHSPVAARWDEAVFQHPGRFVLDGAHSRAGCEACHARGFAGTPTDCGDCHLADYQATVDPAHVAGGFPLECEVCHSTAAWTPALFQHDATGFPLHGRHQGLGCESCHAAGYTGTSTECYSCHRADYQAARDPEHAAAGFPTACEVCHQDTGWEGASFDHNATGFTLSGSHRPLGCEACHANGYDGTPTECYSCHQTDYQAARDPNHVAGGFPRACEVCHNENRWEGAVFDHNATSFPLRGSHKPVACEACHANGYDGTPTDCYSCHQADYRATRDPNHASAGFPTTCEVCHNENRWEGAVFDHNATSFPLRGSHRPLGCEACHANGYDGTPTECIGCHRADYQGTRGPNHVTAGFPTTCEVCHNENRWEGAVFDHNTTSFPLRGSHRPLGCEACHANGYDGTPTECIGCHRADYQGTRDPNHVTAGFPTDCEVCHNENRWEGAVFNHNTTSFPLRDSHADVDCKACHAGGYSGTPRDCYSCHADDYNRTRDPDHLAAGFPTTCESCHRPTRWSDADWNHDAQFFPIYSGEHRRAWDTCADCHVAAGNYRAFECIFCHAHQRGEMDREHREVSRYRYESRACLDCHPDGRGDD